MLGLLLFRLFINDGPNSSSIFKFILFPDDSNLSTSFAEENALKFTLTIVIIINIKTSSPGPSWKNKIVYKLISQPHKHLCNRKLKKLREATND